MDPINAWLTGEPMFPWLPGTGQEQAAAWAGAAASLVLSPLTVGPYGSLSTGPALSAGLAGRYGYMPS